MNEDPNDLESLDLETQELARQVLAMRETNIKMKGEIERLGGAIDTNEARLDYTLAALCSLNFLTARQVWEINLGWETISRPQIRAMRNKMLELSQKKINRDMQAQMAQKNSPSIILPPGVRR